MTPASPGAAGTSITLVRHGRCAHPARGWYDAAALGRWREAYDAAGIVPHESPPATVVRLARDAGLVVTSDLRRARESAARLVPDPVPMTPLLREPPLPMPAWGALRLPLAGWAIVLGSQWVLERLRAAPPPMDVGRQAAAAAEWLVGQATTHGSVLAVTHGAIRRYIAAELIARGWRGPDRRPLAPWSAWTLQRGR